MACVEDRRDTVRQRVAEEIKAGAGLSDQDFSIVTRLVELGDGALRQNELSAALQWDRTRLSHQLTRMEHRGLVSRSAVDGGVLVRITDEGARLVRVARPIHAEAVRKHLLHPTEGTIRLRCCASLSSWLPKARLRRISVGDRLPRRARTSRE